MKSVLLIFFILFFSTSVFAEYMTCSSIGGKLKRIPTAHIIKTINTGFFGDFEHRDELGTRWFEDGKEVRVSLEKFYDHAKGESKLKNRFAYSDSSNSSWCAEEEFMTVVYLEFSDSERHLTVPVLCTVSDCYSSGRM